MKSFDYHIKESTKGMEDHEFRHYNRSLGMMIYSKEHYIHELKKRNLVPDSMAEELRESYIKRNGRKEYKTSPKARSIISELKNCSRNGMIHLGEHPKLVKAMKEIGLDYERNYEELINQPTT